MHVLVAGGTGGLGRLGRRLRKGALCNPDRAVGRVRFQEWATRRVGMESHD